MTRETKQTYADRVAMASIELFKNLEDSRKRKNKVDGTIWVDAGTVARFMYGDLPPEKDKVRRSLTNVANMLTSGFRGECFPCVAVNERIAFSDYETKIENGTEIQIPTVISMVRRKGWDYFKEKKQDLTSLLPRGRCSGSSRNLRAFALLSCQGKMDHPLLIRKQELLISMSEGVTSAKNAKLKSLIFSGGVTPWGFCDLMKVEEGNFGMFIMALQAVGVTADDLRLPGLFRAILVNKSLMVPKATDGAIMVPNGSGDSHE